MSGKKSFVVNYPIIKASESVDIPLFNLNDVLHQDEFEWVEFAGQDYYGAMVEATFIMNCDEDNNYVDILTPMFIITENEIISNAGWGAVDIDEYGIIIDATQTEQTFSKKIEYVIAARETLKLPIVISANRSCSFNLELDIEINNNRKYSWGKFENIIISVGSVYGSNIQSGEYLPDNIYGSDPPVAVYFPYAK